ncbi:unnamed protein product [Musa textilis]
MTTDGWSICISHRPPGTHHLMDGAGGTKLSHHHYDSRPAAPPDGDVCSSLLCSLVNKSALLYLSINVIVSAYHSRSTPSTLTFLLFSYFDLLSLFFCLRRFERLGPGSSPEKKARMKAAIWLLTTALNLALAWRVSETVPWQLAAAVWALAGCVAVGGFYGFFLYKEHA